MDIRKILADYDAMFGKYNLAEIESYLEKQLRQAEAENENRIRVTLLNELIGFCRDTSQREKALAYSQELKQLADFMGMQGTVEYATVLLNIANAYRAFGVLEEASQFYWQVQDIYDNHPDTPEYLYASLYNNWSHVYQATGDYTKAKGLLEKALSILMKGAAGGRWEIQQATTRVNLASALLAIAQQEAGAGAGSSNIDAEAAYGEAVNHLNIALAIFEKDGGRDFHYSAALVAMGDACSYAGNYPKALEYYEKGLREIEKHTGRNANYEKTLAKFENIAGKLSQPVAAGQTIQAGESYKCTGARSGSNMERSREFYENYGRKMIHDEFPEHEHRIAVGLAGEGSDCFGFDDEISADHDYAPGFCMWLTNEDYDKIGARLQAAYDRLVESVYRYKNIDRFIRERRGVATISGFYNKMLRTSCDYQNSCIPDILKVQEFQLAAAANGEVFRDDLGIFTGVRKKILEHYPQDILRRKLAQEIHEFSQYAQSNYPRMMARGDQLTANLCISKAAENAMNIFYLLGKVYAPYYKWKRKGLEKLAGTSEILRVLDEIAATPCQMNAWQNVKYDPTVLNTGDRVVMLFEEAARLILEAMKQQGFATGHELFLEAHVNEVLGDSSMPACPCNAEVADSKAVGCGGAKTTSDNRQKLIQEVMALEWKQFDKVTNEGGRAACQDNYETFHIMRASQYLTWPEELLQSFIDDLKDADARGWNLITEKYARMMQNTDPAAYKTIEHKLPYLKEDRVNLQEAIIKIQVGWMEVFAAEYPKMAGGSRLIHSADDSTYRTSYETYLRGEISTYSEKTFMLYAGFIAEVMKSGRNLTREIMENTAKIYGYKSLEDAERKHE